MRTVCKENSCAGCMACLEVCPKSAIKIIDTIKEYNAVIDERECIECGLCHKICQNNRDIELVSPISWFQGWSFDKRMNSSSGGVASALISSFVENGGVVCSCAFVSGKFGFYFAPDEIGAEQYKGSKYVKSSPKGIYKRIEKLLIKNKKVLFIGLPCQVAAVKVFIGQKKQENLYTVDLICHGSPSPIILEKFFAQYNISMNEIECISFRSNSAFSVTVNEKELSHCGMPDAYITAFLNGVDYTENCYNCKYATIQRIGDVTLGDSWGSILDIEERKKGISLILCQNKKGKELLENADLYLQDVDIQNAIENNHQLKSPTVCPPQREKFFKLFYKNISLNKIIALVYPKDCIKQFVKACLTKIGLRKV